MSYKKLAIGAGLVLSFGAFVLVASADHSWSSYHWARQSNPFTLKVVDSVTSVWDSYLDEANVDWSASSVLDLTKENGSTNSTDRRRCKPVAGKIHACNYSYGNNGWLGLAQIWVSGSHITKATTKVNDTYFNNAYYDTPAWRRLVMCQEIAHDFGLDHQDVIFDNANLGSCMDYTDDPDGPPSNEHPNTHDYDQLETIYSHLDAVTTVGQIVSGRGNAQDVENWGKSVRQDGKGRTSVYERDLGKGEKEFTFVFWAE